MFLLGFAFVPVSSPRLLQQLPRRFPWRYSAAASCPPDVDGRQLLTSMEGNP